MKRSHSSLRVFLAWVFCISGACAAIPDQDADASPYLVVLGIAQDGGVPQIGAVPERHEQDFPAWQEPFIQRLVADPPLLRRLVVSLAVVDPATKERWLFEATPDIKQQLYRLDALAPVPPPAPGLSGIFLTHAHLGHYTGLAQLGHEALGASGVPVFAMPRMRRFLSGNGPWDQLLGKGNITLEPLADGKAVRLNRRLAVAPVLVPHRQEYSEVVGFVIAGVRKRVLFIPDIDSWEELDGWAAQAATARQPNGPARQAGSDAQGVLAKTIEELIASVDVAYLDGTFYANGEIPGRDMTGFPHPFITHSMRRFASLPARERAKVRFIHLNHTNPALLQGSPARRAIEAAGFKVAEEMERVRL